MWDRIRIPASHESNLFFANGRPLSEAIRLAMSKQVRRPMMSNPGAIGSTRTFHVIVGIGIVLAAFAVVVPARAQTFHVLSTLPDEWFSSQLTMDQAGNLYGVTANSGYGEDDEMCEDGCGAVFELYRNNSQWVLITLYTFQGVADGFNPQGHLTFDPNGAVLYGTTLDGGFWGYGTVYRLTPLCNTVCNGWLPWKHTVLYNFQKGNCDTGCDGRYPSTPVTFDQAGNLYGITEFGGIGNNGTGAGTAFKVSPRSPRGAKWEEKQLHVFGTTQTDGREPQGSLLRDNDGNLYGTTLTGGDNNLGTVYDLVDNQEKFSEVVLHSFNDSDGAYPVSGVIADPSGNLYGTTYSGSSGGTVYELSPSGNGWTFSILYKPQPGQASSLEGLAIDAAGSLYGVGFEGGKFNVGTIYKLTPTENGWVYTSLHDFTGALDGEYPESLYLDSRGNLYGSAHCGTGCETSLIWMITPN
jgi:hypothetical protein